MGQPFAFQSLQILTHIPLDQGRQALFNFRPDLMVPRRKTLPGEITFIKDDLRGEGVSQALFVKKAI